MAKDKNKVVDNEAVPMHRWVTTRKTKKYIIIKYPKFFTKNTKVVGSGFTIQLLPWVKTAQVCLANRTIDIPVDRLETSEKVDITFDADITYRVSGEAFFEDYWAKHKAELIDKYSDDDELLGKEMERAQLIADIQRLIDELNHFISMIPTGYTQTDEDKAEISNKIKAIYARIQNGFNINNRKYNEECAALGLVVSDPNAWANLTFDLTQYNRIADMLTNASELLSNPIRSKERNAHRAPIKKLFSLGVIKLKAKNEWTRNHPALIYKLENNPVDLRNMIMTVVKDCLAKYCSRHTEKDIRSGFVNNDAEFMQEVNTALAVYGIELVDVKLKKIDQADKGLSEAYAKQLIAEEEKKAKEIAAQGDAAKIKINVAALKEVGLSDAAVAQILQLQSAPNAQVIAIPGLEQLANAVVQRVQPQAEPAPVAEPVQEQTSEPVQEPVSEPVQAESEPFSTDFREVQEPVAEPVQEPTPAEPEQISDPDLPKAVQFDSLDENADIQSAPVEEPVSEPTPAEPEPVVEEPIETAELSTKEKLFYARLELQAKAQKKLFDEAFAEYQQLVANGTIEEAATKLEELDKIHDDLEEINKQLIKK